MADDAAKINYLAASFRRRVKKGTLSTSALEDIAADAGAKMVDGTTIVEVTIEGGTTRAQVNCDPSLVLAAAEAIIAENDSANTLADADTRHKYADFSGGPIET